MKLLEENREVPLHDLGLGDGLLHITPKASATKEKISKLGGEKERKKIDKLDFTKLKTLMHRRKLLRK